MDERLDWFPCFPSKLLNALAGMKPDEGYVYWIVCLRIYETGKPCRDSADVLSRRSGIPRRRVEVALALSFRAGRLVETEAGIVNPFAAGVLADMAERHERRKSAGKEGASRRWEKTQRKQKRRDGGAIDMPMPIDAQLQSTDTVKPSPNGDGARARAKRGRTALPTRTELNEVGVAYAAEHGFNLPQAVRMFERFADYHRSKGNLMADWDAAWRTWVRNQVEFAKRDGGGDGPRPNGGVQVGRGAGRGSYATAAARLRANIEERQRGFDYDADEDAADHRPNGRH